MTQPFFTGFTGDPILTKRRIAPQSIEGIPAVTGFSDFRGDGGPLMLQPKAIDRMVLTSTPEPPNRLSGKLDIANGPLFMGDVDPANKGIANLLANLFRWYIKTTPSSGVTRYFMSANPANAGASGGATAAPFLTLQNDNDVIPRQRFRDCLTSGCKFGAGPNANYACEFPLVAGQVDFHDDPTQTAGTGSTLPILGKTWSGNWVADGTDKDIYIKVISAAGKTFKAKVSSAATYGSTVYTWTAATPTRIYDFDDSIIGAIAEQVTLIFTTSPTLADNDEFKIKNRRASWSASLGTERPISSINTIFYLNGAEVRMEGGWNITGAVPGVLRLPDTSGRQSARSIRRGPMKFTLAPTREIADLDIQIAMYNQTPITVVIEAKTDALIGASVIPYRLLYVFPSCIPDGNMFDTVQGGQKRDEAPTLVAGVPASSFAYGGMTFTEAATCVIDTDFSSL